MSEDMTQKGHPKGLYVLFITEMWERFSYYGMRALLTLFMIKALLLDKSISSQIYGSYTGLVYLTPLLGGYMADRYWGNRKSIIIGGVLMAIGQFFMFISGSLLGSSGATFMMFTGLAFLIFGNGFFKPNISTMVGQLYSATDKRKDSAFTIFYMGINLGAFIAPLICGTFGDTGSPADFKWGFLAACIGMVLSLILFIWLKNHYIVTPEGEQIGVLANSKRETIDIDSTSELKSQFSQKTILTWLIIFVVLLFLFLTFTSINIIGSFIFSLSIAAPGFIISDGTLSKIEKEKIWVIYIIAFFVIFFWAAFEQAGASLTFFAEEQTDRNLNLNISRPIIYLLLISVISISSFLIFKVLKSFKNEVKFLKEVITILLSILILYCIYSFTTINENGFNLKELPASYFQSVNAIAIVVFAPLFALIWTKLGSKNMEPASPFKQAIGLFLLAVGYMFIAIFVKDLGINTKVSMLVLITLYTIHTFGELCLSPIGLSMVNKLSPVKFASLLMGVWFLSTAAANFFAGTLSGLYPEDFKIKTVSTINLNKVIVYSDSGKSEQIIEPNESLHNLLGNKKVLKVTFASDNKVEKEKTIFENLKGKFISEKEVEDSILSIVVLNKTSELEVSEKISKQTLPKILTEKEILEAELNKDFKISKASYNFNEKGNEFYILQTNRTKDKTSATLNKISLDEPRPDFLGMKINNLYDFFMLFVYMSGAAALILFILSKKLVKMMHGVK
jgi:POT family proton-dependent oligopeptide transporter